MRIVNTRQSSLHGSGAGLIRLGMLLIGLMGITVNPTQAQQYPPGWRIMDRDLEAYFEAEVRKVEETSLAGVQTLDDWKGQREERKRQLYDMLGLWPIPARTDLQAVVTGRLEGDGFNVEKIRFQSMPGLHVTANLYLPLGLTGRVPAILYVCGHAEVKTNGISLGNKAAYQHHGSWLAQHGYACLMIDTLQLGEIQGDHHGTYRLGQWWWNSRGYTPAGVEAWNSIRALDYLQSRPEIDPERLGMTGRSGGGSYTWTTATLDERVKVAAPVAGITDLRNHVCDGAVEGHCDCMFFINTYRWDFAMQAALMAPRPLLVVNTDSDNIFPLDGVTRLFNQVRRIYGLHDAYDQVGLVIGPGPHADSQNLQMPVLRWFNRHLKGEDPLVHRAAVKGIDPAELRVFEALPSDQRNTTAQEWMGPGPGPRVESLTELRHVLRDRVFMGWPVDPGALAVEQVGKASHDGLRLRLLRFQSQRHVPLWLLVVEREGDVIADVGLEVMDSAGWQRWLRSAPVGFGEALKEFEREAGARESVPWVGPEPGTAWVGLVPRGLGPATWPGDARKQVQIRRRFQLLGQTLDGMRVWDVRRGMAAVREVFPHATGMTLRAEGLMAAHALHAAVFEAPGLRLELQRLPESYRDGPDYLNVAKITDPAEVLRWVRQGR